MNSIEIKTIEDVIKLIENNNCLGRSVHGVVRCWLDGLKENVEERTSCIRGSSDYNFLTKPPCLALLGTTINETL